MRSEKILRYIDATGLGVEVAPFADPLLPKRAGYRVKTLDVLDRAALREKVLADPFIPNEAADRIEDIDFVGSATEIGALLEREGLLGALDFVVSSHNFEHLANPIKFLRGVAAGLKTGGVLAMVVPDGRASFDHFRAPTRLADWLEAWREDRVRPSPAQIFDCEALTAHYYKDEGGEPALGCNMARDVPHGFEPVRELERAWADWTSGAWGPQTPYHDAHCSVFFGPSLELMLRDLRQLGLIDLEVVDVTPTEGLEFCVALRKTSGEKPSADVFYARRKALLVAINRSMGWAGYPDAGRRGWIDGSGTRRKTLGERIRAEIRRFRRRRSR